MRKKGNRDIEYKLRVLYTASVYFSNAMNVLYVEVQKYKGMSSLVMKVLASDTQVRKLKLQKY